MNKPLFDNGMQRRVLIQKLSREHIEEGVFGDIRKTLEFDRLIVWAEAGLKDVFMQIKGVMLASPDSTVGQRYVVSVDPRYDIDWVTREIEAVAILNFDRPAVPFPAQSKSEWEPSFAAPDSDVWSPDF